MGTMKSFNFVLSSLRKETGRSQRRVAADLGVSQALLSHYENGAREPKFEFVLKACTYYGVTADYMLGRVDERATLRLPKPQSCEGAPRLISATCAVFDTLDERSDTDLYSATVNYLLIPIENADSLLRDPEAPYEPARDAKLKLAESELVKLARDRKLADVREQRPWDRRQGAVDRRQGTVDRRQRLGA